MFWKVQNDLKMQTLSLQKKKRKKKVQICAILHYHPHSAIFG